MSMGAAPMTPMATTPKLMIVTSENPGGSEKSAASTSYATKVFNKQRNKFHMVVPPSIKSRCNFWTCGDKKRPAANADFEYDGPGTKCTKCFFR